MKGRKIRTSYLVVQLKKKILVCSDTHWVIYMVLTQGLIYITWMQVRWDFRLKKDNYFSQRITICCGHNLHLLGFDTFKKNIMGTPSKFDINIDISYIPLISLLVMQPLLLFKLASDIVICFLPQTNGQSVTLFNLMV